MTVFGFHASHEQVHPRQLLETVQLAEQVGFTAAMCSDHFSPWSERQAHSAFPPPLLAAAVSPKTAAWAAEWADGLATVLQSHQALREVIEAYWGAGGTGPLVLQVHLSYATDDEIALQIAHDQWRTNVFAPPVCWDLDHVVLFDEAGRHVPPEAMQGPVLISSDPARHVEWLQELVALGFDEVYLHHVGQEQSEWLEVFVARVLPQLDVTAKVAA